jgi:hypothetical protein
VDGVTTATTASSLTTYLVERYWPGVSPAELADAMTRARRSASTMRRQGKRIRYLQATLVPDQETVLCLMEAESADLVAELNERARIPYDRIAEAIAVEVSATSSARPRQEDR